MDIIAELKAKRAAIATDMKALHESYNEKQWDSAADEKFQAMSAEVADIDKTIAREEQLLNLAADAGIDNALRNIEEKAEHEGNTIRAIHAKWLRGGDKALSAEEIQTVYNTMSTGAGSEGGYTVDKEIASYVISALKEYGAMRPAATVINTAAGNEMNWPTSDGTSEEGEIVGENQSVTDEDIVFGTKPLVVYKYSSKGVAVPFELLQDSSVDIEAYVNGRLVERLGRVTDKHFTKGTGSGQPTGIMTAAGVAVTAAGVDAVTYEEMLELKHSVDPAYRRNGPKWMFNDSTLLYLKKNLKDTQGRPLWLPSIREDAPDTFDGDGYVINQQVDVMGAGNVSIGYGDMKRYIIRDAMDIMMFRMTDSAYTRKGQVGFLMFLRAGGNLVDVGGAFKTLEMAAS